MGCRWIAHGVSRKWRYGGLKGILPCQPGLITALILGMGWWSNQHQPNLPVVAEQVSEDTYNDPKAAYEATKAALKRLSKGLKKGIKNTRQELKTMPKLKD